MAEKEYAYVYNFILHICISFVDSQFHKHQPKQQLRAISNVLKLIILVT